MFPVGGHSESPDTLLFGLKSTAANPAQAGVGKADQGGSDEVDFEGGAAEEEPTGAAGRGCGDAGDEGAGFAEGGEPAC